MLSRGYHTSHLPYYHFAAEHGRCSISPSICTQEPAASQNTDCISKTQLSQFPWESLLLPIAAAAFSYTAAASQLSIVMP